MTVRTVTLVKHEPDDGMPVGEEYTWTYTTASLAMARARAFVALRRDHPAEDSARWKVAE